MWCLSEVTTDKVGVECNDRVEGLGFSHQSFRQASALHF